jgi:tRNA pseudouridine55 synthase
VKDGLLLIDKQMDCTSHDVVQQARRILRQKKIGHCGTLDPDATGLLLLTLGKATRLTRFLIRAPKVYEGVLRLGVSTDTYDASGKVTAEGPAEGVTLAAIQDVMSQFVGTHPQSPPPYSAKKVGGVRFYELARRGEEVPESSKDVTVYEFAAVGALAEQRLAFRLGCSSGTYARSLAHDVGQRLGCGAHLAALRRTRIGSFQVENALTLDALATLVEAGSPVGPAWVSFDEVALPFAEVAADAQQEHRIVNGQTVLMRDFHADEGDWVKVVNRRHEFIAVGTVIERIGTAGVGVIQPKVVFK